MESEINSKILSLINKTPDFFIKGVAGRVKARRLEMNLTQKALAIRADMPLSTYRRFEVTGEISFRSLVVLAVVLGMTDEFEQLFANKTYQSIDEILNSNVKKKRKRGKKTG